MELKKSNCTYALNIPDYDSTKANFDELESETKGLRARFKKMIKRFNSLCDLVAQMERASENRDEAIQKRLDRHSKKMDDVRGRLTALEAKPCIDCNRCADRFGCEWFASHTKPPDTSAKVNAPAKLCYRCGGEQRVWLQTAMWGEGVTSEVCPECKGTGRQPLPTCGNCAKSWRRDNEKNHVACCWGAPFRTLRADHKGCPYHEWR